MINYNEKYDFKSDYVQLSSKDIEALISPLITKSSLKNHSILNGGYSNTNYKLDFSAGEESKVLRISQKNLGEFKKEIAVLEWVKDKVNVPKVLTKDFNTYPAFALLSFCPGELLSGVSDDQYKLGSQVGQTLSQIHSLSLDASGFFDDTFSFAEPFEHFGKSFYEYTLSCLDSDRIIQRLGAELHIQLLNYVKANEDKFIAIGNPTNLIHCDFNSKNILLKNENQLTVLDWEFACAGSPLVDIGNFLRFENEIPAALKDGFIDGYIKYGGTLPKDWQQLAKLLDLSSMLTFLNTKAEKPKTFATAIAVIKSTLSYRVH
jgi:thiamine kinase-like enzyme